MPKIKGKWLWNAEIREPYEMYDYIINTSFVSNGESFSGLICHCTVDPITMFYKYDKYNSVVAGTYDQESQRFIFKEEYRLIDFGTKEKDVDDSFYIMTPEFVSKPSISTNN